MPIHVTVALALMLFAGAVPSASAPAPIGIAVAARSIRPGELVVLTIGSDASPRVHAFDRDWIPFRLDARRWRVLIGIDLDVVPGRYPVTIEAGSGPAAVRATYPLVVTPRAFPSRTLTVAEGFVNPPPEMAERIEREAARLHELWRSPTPDRLWQGSFVRPVPDPANSAFGTRSTFNGQPRSPHSGADFDSPAGRPIKAPNAGRIVLAGALYFTGNTVVIDHGLGLLSLFAHLSVIDVREGDSVAVGDRVGLVGATGRVTGPHLHWTVRLGEARVDPLSLLDVLGRRAAPASAPRGGPRRSASR